MPPTFPYWKHFKAIDPIVTISKTLRMKVGKIFCEGLNLICKLFQISGQKDFQKPVIFPNFSKHYFIEVAHGNLIWFCLALIPHFSPSELTESTFKTLKNTKP